MEYGHGGDIYTNQVKMDYSANINPLGLPDGVKAALVEAVNHCSCYPDSRCTGLIKKLSGFHQVRPEWVICGNGAADLIFQVVQAVRPRQALLIAPSFLEYEQALRTVGTKVSWFDLKETSGFCLDAEAYISYLKQSTYHEKMDMVFLCNPNNPTGLAIKREDMMSILDYCEAAGIFCVLDECFAEFLEEPAACSVMDQAVKGRWKNLFLLKAFTKIYAMAGIRLGYGICCQEAVPGCMETIRQPWTVSSLAQAAGVAALEERDYVKRTRALITKERLWLRTELEELGFFVYDSMANYLFFRDLSGEDGILYRQCLDRGLLIRSCGNYRGLDGTYYRICVKTRQENQLLRNLLKEIQREKRRTKAWQKRL